MSYHELKERFERLQDTDFNDDIDQGISDLNDLAEDMLFELGGLERAWYLFKNDVPSEVHYFYPRITKDPTVSCYKDNHELIGTQSLKNLDFTKLYDLGLYALSDSPYYIRTIEQLGYISNFLEGELKEVVGFDGYHYEISFD
jgi:hypothetical protein